MVPQLVKQTIFKNWVIQWPLAMNSLGLNSLVDITGLKIHFELKRSNDPQASFKSQDCILQRLTD